MLQLSYISFLILSVVIFFSPTLKSIFGIAGILFYLAFLLQNPNFAINPKLKSLNKIALILFITNTITALFYKNDFATIANNIFGDYIFWICISSLIYNLNLKNKFFEFNFLNSKLKINYSESFLILISISSLITSIYVLLQVSRILPSLENGVLGILSQPFTSSGLLLISVFVTLSLRDLFKLSYSQHKILVSRIFYLLLVIQISAIVALGQITVWGGLILAFIYYFFANKSLNLKKIIFAALCIIVVISLAQNSSPRIERKLKWFSSYEKLTKNKSISCRYAIWEQNLKAFKTRPLVGLREVIPYECTVKKDSSHLTHMHNIFLQKLIKGGFLRFILWLSFYLMIFYQLYKEPRKTVLPMMCIFIGLFFEGLLENWWDDGEVLNLFFLCLAVFLNSCFAEASQDKQ